MFRSDDEQNTILFSQIDALLHGRDEFSNCEPLEKIEMLQKWSDRLSDWRDSLVDASDENSTNKEMDTFWIERSTQMISRIDNAIEVLAKNDWEKTTEERIYGGSD